MEIIGLFSNYHKNFMTDTLLLNTDQFPIEEKHVAFFTQENGYDITLMEVVEAFYPHPNAPKDAKISRLEIRTVAKEKTNSFRAAGINLVKYANDNAINTFLKL